MRIALRICLSVFVLCAILLGAVAAQIERRDMAFEGEVLERLGEIDRRAVPGFKMGTEMLDAEEWDSARISYLRVLELAPGFPDAMRRLAYVELGAGNPEQSLAWAEWAYEVDPESPWNLSTLVMALYMTQEDENMVRALPLAKEAAQELPGDVGANILLLALAAYNEDIDAVRMVAPMVVELDPDQPLGHFYVGVMAGLDGDMVLAERELERSMELGTFSCRYSMSAVSSASAISPRIASWGLPAQREPRASL